MPSPSQNGGPHARPSSPGVGALDLDDVGAERGQDLRAVGPGDRRRHVEHALMPASGRCTGAIIAASSATMGRMFDQFVGPGVRRPRWSYVVIFGVSHARRVLPDRPEETVVITGGVVGGRGDLSLLLVIVCAASAGAVSSATTSRTGSRLARRAHGQERFGSRTRSRQGVRLGRGAARGPRLLPDHHRPVHSRRPDRRDVLVRVHAWDDVPALRRRRRDRGHRVGDVRGAARLHRRQAVRGGAVERADSRLRGRHRHPAHGRARAQLACEASPPQRPDARSRHRRDRVLGASSGASPSLRSTSVSTCATRTPWRRCSRGCDPTS